MLKLIATALAVSLAVPAMAQQNCAPYDDVRAALFERYGEVTIATGMVSGGQRIMEMLVNEETGSWTVVYISTAGIACQVAAGSDYGTQAIPQGDPT